VIEEPPVLSGDHGIDDMARQQVEGHEIVGLAALGQQRAVGRQHLDHRCLVALAQGGWVRKTDGVVDEGEREHDGTAEAGEQSESRGRAQTEPAAGLLAFAR
jgi:hypothetical protein